jgi:hypothetical protein
MSTLQHQASRKEAGIESHRKMLDKNELNATMDCRGLNETASARSDAATM